MVALALALVLGTAPLAVAAPSGDPTWAEVQAAKKDVRLQAREVAKIQHALDGLEAEAARLGTIALQRAQAAEAAEWPWPTDDWRFAGAIERGYEQLPRAARGLPLA